MMGWDSRPWKSHPFFWSDNTPEKFRELCRRAKDVMDSSATAGPEKTTGIFCCWNEFGEGHYIEPNRGSGFSYLDAIREVFCEGPKEHVDIARKTSPPASESWYLAARSQTHDDSHRTSWSGKLLEAWKGGMGSNGSNYETAFCEQRPPTPIRRSSCRTLNYEQAAVRKWSSRCASAGRPARPNSSGRRQRRRRRPRLPASAQRRLPTLSGTATRLLWARIRRGRMHYVASVRSGDGKRRDGRDPLDPAGVARTLQP